MTRPNVTADVPLSVRLGLFESRSIDGTLCTAPDLQGGRRRRGNLDAEVPHLVPQFRIALRGGHGVTATRASGRNERRHVWWTFNTRSALAVDAGNLWRSRSRPPTRWRPVAQPAAACAHVDLSASLKLFKSGVGYVEALQLHPSTACEGRPKNRLLGCLPTEDFERMEPHLRTLPVKPKQVFHALNEPIQHIIFLNGGVASVTA
jgi:hypothetical protein